MFTLKYISGIECRGGMRRGSQRDVKWILFLAMEIPGFDRNRRIPRLIWWRGSGKVGKCRQAF